ncbi:IS5 family transposase [Streptomyces sp. NBC_01445]|uniref:IS5 family transposase n=1 Tax=Streptomyces sp. NBC_01445 TaxID=2903869 RepID=UPI002DDC14F6|nr:IS5 family transposase [Streptomyces sp. NBC_01445]WSE02145.1 IS5 family transposase [Streptomyces sp. NBC_01445]
MSQSAVSMSVEASSSARSCDCLVHRFGNAADHPNRLPCYGSDMTEAEWQVVRAALPVPAWLEGRGGRPEGYCHRIMIDAVRYVVDNGVKWRNLPADFPPFRRVHAFARRWQVCGLLTELHDRLRDAVRVKEGRKVDPTAAIVDSQSLRAAASVPRTTSGWDGGKKVGGRKRHLAVDALGLLLVVLVTAASVQDRDAGVPLLSRLREGYFSIRLVWADGGYAGRLVDWASEELQLTLEIVKRSDDTAGFVVLPRRWVVERTLSWLVRSRRLVRDYEVLTAMHEAMVQWSMTMLMGSRLAGRRRDAFTPRPTLH